MAGRPADPGEFDRALDTFLPLSTIRLIIQLVREYYEMYGEWPSDEKIHALLKQPGK